MRLNRWVYAAVSSFGLFSGALVEQACGNGDYCTGSGASQICYLYTPETMDAGVVAVRDGGTLLTDGAVDAFVPWEAGTGAACLSSPGDFPSPSCDPSDEMGQGCQGGVDSGCVFSPKCGDLHTCEPFTTNPIPGTGIDSFRMRLLNVTAPPALTKPVIQSAVVSTAVDLPASPDAGGAPCGEDGSGLFNWIIQVDKTNSKIITGGAPPSNDPFDLGYCFINGTVLGTPIAPITVPVTFDPNSNTFSSKPLPGTLNIPIFLPMTNLKGVVILPISGISVYDVTMSDDGNCIGAVNNNGSLPGASGACMNNTASGPESCSRWHSAGAFGGYITLKGADAVTIVSLGGESLCVLLTGEGMQTCPTCAETCSPAGLTAGDYCSGADGRPQGPCTNGDSMWMAAQFAASAVKVYTPDAGAPVTLCNGGSISATDGG